MSCGYMFNKGKVFTWYKFEECPKKKDVYEKCINSFGKGKFVKTAKKDGLFYYVMEYPDGKLCCVFDVKKRRHNWEVGSHCLEEEEHTKDFLPKCIQKALK